MLHSSTPARVRAQDSSAIRTLPSVVDDDGVCGCDFEGPACDGTGVGSGYMVQVWDVVDALQVSGNTLQEVEKFNYLGVIFTSGGRWRLIHGLVKQMQFCVNLIALWSQNGNFQTQ